MSEITHLEELIRNYTRRLHKLKEQQALVGLNAAPERLIEIEDIEEILAKLQTNLKELEDNIARTPTTLTTSAGIGTPIDNQRTKKEQILAELLSPIVLQLERTEQAFKRWNSLNLYLEAKIILAGNVIIRDLLVTKSHLIPPDLMPDAQHLVTHYDRWLEEYDKIRGGAEPDLTEPFVFTGPQGYPFPRSSAQRFQDKYAQLQRELYETEP